MMKDFSETNEFLYEAMGQLTSFQNCISVQQWAERSSYSIF